MWFEMGVRDNVTNSLGKILEMTKILQGDMNKVVASAHALGTIKPVKFDNGKAVRDALNYQKMLLRIDDTMERISARKLTATVGVDKLDHAAKQLQDFRDQLVKLQLLNGNDWNGDMLTTQNAALRNVLQVVNNLLREQQNAQNGAAAQAQANAKANMDLVAAYDKVVEKGGAATKVLGQLQNQIGTYVSLYGAERLMKSIIEIGGEFEVQHIALQSILGDLEQANTMFNQIKQLAVVSPFNFKELVTYSKQVAAFNVPYEEMYDTTRRLADMSAGLGVDIGRLILAYGQVRSAAVLRGQELRQFTEAGIPMVQALADEFTKLNGKATTTGEVFELISKRAVPFEMVKKVLWDMTNEGGRFYNMQFTLADTLTGKWSNLVDAWQIMLSEYAKGESITGKITKGFVQGLTWIIENINSLSSVIGGAFGAFAAVKTYSLVSKLISLGITGYNKQIALAQQLNATKIRELYIQGEITKAEMQARLNRNKDLTLWRMNLILSGRMNKLALAKLDYTKKENKQLLIQMVRTQQIDAATRRLLLNGKSLQAVLLMMRTSMSSMLTFTNLWGVALQAAVAVAGWLAVDYFSSTNDMKEATNSAYESMKQRYDDLYRFVKDNPIGPIIDGSDEKQIKDMIERYEEAIKDAAPEIASDIIAAAVGGTDSLNDQLKNLKSQVELLQRAQVAAKDLAGSFDEAAESTNHWNTEGITSNMQDFQNAINDYIKQTKGWRASDYEDLANKLVNVGVEAENSGRILSNYEKNLVKIGTTVKKMIARGNTFEAIARYIGLANAANTPSASDRKFDLGIFDMSGGLFTKSYAQQKETFDKQLTDVYNDIKQRMLNKGQNLATDVGRRTFQMLATEWMGRNQFSNEMQSYAQLFWDSIINGEYNVKSENLSRIVADTMKSLDKDGILNKYITGEDTSDNTKKRVMDIFAAAKDEITAKYPEFKNVIDKTFEGSPLILPLNVRKALDGNTKELTEWQIEINKYFKDHNINIPITADMSQEDLYKKVKEYKDELQTKLDNSGKVLIGIGLNLSSLPNELPSPLATPWNNKNLADYKEDKTALDEINDAIKKFNMKIETKHDKGNKEKKDEVLDMWKNRISLLEKYKKELEELEKLMPRVQAQQKLREDKNFDSLWGYFSNPNDYQKSLDEAIRNLNRKGQTKDRKKYIEELGAKKESDSLQTFKESIKDSVSELQRMMSVMSENYQTYKKWVELTGDKRLAANIAGVTQNTSYASYLTDLMKKELDKADLKMSPNDIFGMNEAQLKEYGENNGISAVWKAWQENAKKVKKEQWDMYESAIKSAKSYEDKLNDINRKLEREKGLINQLNIPQAEKDKLIKNRTDEAGKETSKLVWDNFKETEDWGRIFSNLDRVSNATIENMIQELEKVAPKIKGSVEDTKALYEALDKLRDQQEKRNQFAAMSSALGAASLARSLMGQFGTSKVNPKATIGISKSEAKKLGLGDATRVSYGRLQDIEKGSENKFNESLSGLQNEFKALQDVLKPVIDMFDALGNKTLSDIFSAGSNALGSAASTAGAFSTLSNAFGGKDKPIGKILGNAGPWGAVAAAGLSIVTTAIGMFGADYGDYNKMKEQYEGLINVWDDLIDRKKEYLSESWGEEAKRAGKEALSLLKSEIEQTKVVAESRLGSGSSWGSHSIEYRMWEGSYDYNGKNWRDVAKEVSRALNGVKFESMSDMLNMSAEQLLWIKENYAGLWAHMDSDFKEYLEKLIKYGDAEKDLLDELQQKLTGMDFEDMVSEYANSLSSMEDANAELGENLEENLKNAILSAMIANVYGDRIKKLIAKTNELGSNNDKILDQSGKVVSEYTAAEYAEIKSMNDQLEREMEESRDMLARTYGWTNKNGSSSTNSLGKAITEQDTSLWSSYLNAIRLDVSVNRVTLADILKLVQSQGEMPVIARAQLEQLKAIAINTSRNAEAAERIYNLLHGVAPDGTSIKIK